VIARPEAGEKTAQEGKERGQLKNAFCITGWQGTLQLAIQRKRLKPDNDCFSFDP
jgi:hypothetical protein